VAGFGNGGKGDGGGGEGSGGCLGGAGLGIFGSLKFSLRMSSNLLALAGVQSENHRRLWAVKYWGPGNAAEPPNHGVSGQNQCVGGPRKEIIRFAPSNARIALFCADLKSHDWQLNSLERITVACSPQEVEWGRYSDQFAVKPWNSFFSI
jgi:hypothetical protein